MPSPPIRTGKVNADGSLCSGEELVNRIAQS